MQEKNPRYWSSNTWNNTSIIETLKEVVEPEEVSISSIQMNENLCELIWDGSDNMIDEVRLSLLKNAKEFIHYSDIDNLKYEDIILTGSLANYNYTRTSDLDIHILLDFKQISDNIELVGNFLKMKKRLWSEILPIQIKKFDVELYFQDINETHHSSGTYSILKNKWICKPTKKIININVGNIQIKSANYMNMIDDLSKKINNDNFMVEYDKLKNKLRKYRQSGLDKSGEYSTENLVFKVLRHTGYLKKLVDLKNEYLTKELTLKEFKYEEEY